MYDQILPTYHSNAPIYNSVENPDLYRIDVFQAIADGLNVLIRYGQEIVIFIIINPFINPLIFI